MKIAQIAPLYESVPPQLYGGTERVVYHLSEELVRMGHEVTLYASGDSRTNANLFPQCPRALRLDNSCVDHIVHHVLMVEKLYRDAGKYDIIHSHIDYLPFSAMRRIDTPCITTLHGRLDLPELVPLYIEFPEIPVVSISDAQREPLPFINWQKTIYHGLPRGSYTFQEKPGAYLAFLGRISPEKGVGYAIEIAKAAGMKLKIAAKIDKPDREYYEKHIKRHLNHPLIEYVGEINDSQKNDFLGNACALIFPIDWPEPFGLVMIEAFACGTPVIARNRGSVPEVMEQGVTGFMVNTVEEAASAVKKVKGLNRKRCREVFEERFTVQRMAEDYLEVYEKLLKKSAKTAGIYGRSYSSTG